MDDFRREVKAALEGNSGKIYLVQAGAYEEKENADAWREKLRRAGFEAFIKEENGQYKIQAGAFEKEENARKRMEELEAAGFPAFIVP